MNRRLTLPRLMAMIMHPFGRTKLAFPDVARNSWTLDRLCWMIEAVMRFMCVMCTFTTWSFFPISHAISIDQKKRNDAMANESMMTRYY